jgi:hypothetical protein
MPQTLRYLVLAAVLLFAQQAALSHQVSHIHDVRSDQRQEDSGKKNAVPDLCVFHAMFGTVLGGIGATPGTLRLNANTIERGPTQLANQCRRFPVIPASRGPPHLH